MINVGRLDGAQWLLMAVGIKPKLLTLAFQPLPDLAPAYLPPRVGLFAHHARTTLVLLLIYNTPRSSSFSLFALAISSILMSCPRIFSQMAPSPHSCVNSNAASSEKLSRTMLAKQFPFSNLGSSPSYHLVSLSGHSWKLLIFCLILQFPNQDIKSMRVRVIDLTLLYTTEWPALRTLHGT